MNWTPASIITLIFGIAAFQTIYTAVVILLTRGQYKAAEDLVEHEIPPLSQTKQPQPPTEGNKP